MMRELHPDMAHASTEGHEEEMAQSTALAALLNEIYKVRGLPVCVALCNAWVMDVACSAAWSTPTVLSLWVTVQGRFSLQSPAPQPPSPSGQLQLSPVHVMLSLHLQTLTDPEARAVYDALAGFGDDDKTVNPMLDMQQERDQVFVDEVAVRMH